MKAIVAEIDKKQMIVITDKGDFVKIKRQMSAAIGDEIEFNTRRTYLTYKRLAPIAACFLACIFLSTGVYAYYTPYSYVSVDINPSIAMSLNRFERVISVDAITEDATELIKDAGSLKNQEIDKALSEIIKSASEKGYIDEKAESQVMVVVSAKDPKQEEKLAREVNKAAAKELSKVNKSSKVTVEKTSVESYKEAVANKVSPGREILADKLREVNPEIKYEDVQGMTVKEAMELIKEGRKTEKAAEKDNKQQEKDKEAEQAFQDKKGRNKTTGNEEKNNNGQGKTQSGIAEKNGKMKPSAEPKNNKAGKESKDKETASEDGKPADWKNGAGWDKGPDADKDREEKDKEAGDKDKDKDDKDDKADDRNKNNKGKSNLKEKHKDHNAEELEQTIKDMMKTIKNKKSR